MSNRLAELAAMRRQTQAFIAANPSQVTLTPRAIARTNTGGLASTTLPNRAAQTMRLIDQSGANTAMQGPQRTQDGETNTVEMMLLARYDAIMSVGDTFAVGGFNFQIEAVLPDNGYERRARVVRYG